MLPRAAAFAGVDVNAAAAPCLGSPGIRSVLREILTTSLPKQLHEGSKRKARLHLFRPDVRFATPAGFVIVTVVWRPLPRPPAELM